MLDSKTAQKIADEVMNSLGYNINVMNGCGIIIGSGNKERIGTFHETAMRTIRDCAIYEVTEEESTYLEGVKPGINMPIVGKDGEVLGAVGITGRPDEVRNIGKLVKMTAELIIEQQESIDRMYRHRNNKELFVTSLISSRSGTSEDEMRDWGSRMGYDMLLNRVACIIIPNPVLKSCELEHLLDRLKQNPLHSKQDISVVLGNSCILIFKTVAHTEPWMVEKEVKQYFDQLNETLDEPNQYKGYIGEYYPGIKGYRRSYEEAILMVHNDDSETISFSHHHVVRHFYRLMDEESIEYLLMPYLRRLEEVFGKGMEEAMITLQKLLDNGFHYERAAEDLFVHRNTVIFRKKKIEACLELDPKFNCNTMMLAALLVELYFDPDRSNT